MKERTCPKCKIPQYFDGMTWWHEGTDSQSCGECDELFESLIDILT